ncbi:phosphoadenosine phosphosulfate reductase [Neisseria arctica]|uniref:Adenosine 5'-phosphosulfate reductase n=1 Tax=Neisseria arctica TaxID=1470200 RepID=A0A0J0YRP6_9NEIS|nr:phosphoadenylyl-sulfate reductase [Neisseria arctica]KLT72787.1 phosphoadenosine phosphosulfate reductase [Neisseria arctica]UOO87286.1 phosphoadenylyl-sulfate reductase [Neisseria arctica]
MSKPQLWQVPTSHTADENRLTALEASLATRLQEIAERYPQAVFASSLAVEDMVITDQIARLSLPLRIITLNTGKLNPETEALIDITNTRYSIPIEVYHPQAKAAASFDHDYGISAIYESIEKRKQCCHIRKIEPLNRALSNAPAWLTGQRRSQSSTRTDLNFEEHDQIRKIAKFNPIYDWEEADVWAYAHKYQIPLNDLYNQGYPSIGCEPCTRPVKQGEDIRAGRWWWESRDSKECGLHK